jgi:hypothetical protein
MAQPDNRLPAESPDTGVQRIWEIVHPSTEFVMNLSMVKYQWAFVIESSALRSTPGVRLVCRGIPQVQNAQSETNS